jgi:hypothetical protein
VYIQKKCRFEGCGTLVRRTPVNNWYHFSIKLIPTVTYNLNAVETFMSPAVVGSYLILTLCNNVQSIGTAGIIFIHTWYLFIQKFKKLFAVCPYNNLSTMKVLISLRIYERISTSNNLCTQIKVFINIEPSWNTQLKQCSIQ